MLERLILAYLARQGFRGIADIAGALGYGQAEVQVALDTLVNTGLASVDLDTYGPTQAGIDSLLTAPVDQNVSALVTSSINTTFSEGVVADPFLEALRTNGFTAADARELSYLAGEYGVGASIEQHDVNILVRCARLSRLAAILAAAI